MQLQNKEVKIKYSVILDQDELDAIIIALENVGNNWRLTDEQDATLASLKAFRGKENEPTETCGA